MLFNGFQNALPLIIDAIKVFKKYPKLLTPLLFTWCFYAFAVIMSEFIIDWEVYSLSQVLMIVFGFLLVFSFFLSFSCSILMELIRQIEFGEPVSFLNAVSDSGTRNLLPLLPVVVIWAILMFILTLLEALLSKFRGNKHKDLNPENVAKTLGGWEVFSWVRLLFYYTDKAIRMIFFLVIPSIVWHDPNFLAGFKEAIKVVQKHAPEFIAGFIITEAAGTLIFLPITIMFILARTFAFADWAWVMASVYISLAWSFSIYLEQMFVAELYLWHRKWQKECLINKELGKPLPKLSDIKKPSLLDDSVNDLVI